MRVLPTTGAPFGIVVGVVVSIAAAMPLAAHAAQILGIRFSGQVFLIDPDSGASALLHNNGAIASAEANSLARTDDGRFYSAFGGTLVQVSPLDGVASNPLPIALAAGGTTTPARITGLTAAPNGELYAINRGAPGTDDVLWRINPITGQGILVGATGFDSIQGLAFAPDGFLYAWDTGDGGGLLRITAASGATVDLNGAAGPPADVSIQTLAFAPDGRLFGAESALYLIDRATGELSPQFVSLGGANLRGMEFIALASPIQPVDEPPLAALLALTGLLFLRLRRQRAR